MLITQIISQYLQANRRITVAGLGTFLTKTGSTTIVFSEFLKDDDGILRSLLIESGLKELEAMAILDRFVFDLRYALMTEGRMEYLLPMLGRMTYVGGMFSFEYDPEVVAAEVELAEEPLASPTTVITEPKPQPEPIAKSRPEPEPIAPIKLQPTAEPTVEEPTVDADNLFDSFAGYADEGRNVDVRESLNKWWFIFPAIAVVVVLVALFYWLAVEWMYGNIQVPDFLDSLLRSIFTNEGGVPGSTEL